MSRDRSDPFRFDRRHLAALSFQATVVAGADEVGRGSLAGPLVAAAVMLDYRRNPARLLRGLTDSKLLRPVAREKLFGRIMSAAESVVFALVSAEHIDREGLHRSNLAALIACLEKLGGSYDLALVDGFDLGRPDLRAQRVLQGDQRSAVIAAASVVAKVSRDRLMHRLDPIYPVYGFGDNVGYGTRRHRDALREHGPCPYHRRSFVGVGTTQLELWEPKPEVDGAGSSVL